MKYIRTKQGVFELDDESLLKDNKVPKFVSRRDDGYPGYQLEYDTVVKAADTIEELCDEFVAFESGFLRPRLEFKNIDESVLYAFIHCAKNECPNAGLFGAIWTDKGLIYVAKMNDKGELELL